MPSIVDLLFRINARTEQVASATASIQQLGSSFGSLGRSALSIVGINLSVQALVGFLKSSVREALSLQDHFQDVAEQLDTTSEAVQVLDYAGRRMGSGIDELTRLGLQLNQRLQEAASRGGEAAKFFDALGLSIGDLLEMPFERRLEAFGRALARGEDDARAMDAAIQLTGTRSQRLLNIVEQIGTRGLPAFAEEARAAGQVMDADLTAAVARADQSLEDLNRRWTILLGSMASPTVDFLDMLGASGSKLKAEEALLRNMERLRPILERFRSLPGAEEELARIDAQARHVEELRAHLAASAGAPPTALSDVEAAAARRANAEREAGLWLAKNGEKLQEQLSLAQETVLADEQRAAAIANRFAALQREHAAALANAAGENERRKLTLEFDLARAKLLKENEELLRKIGSVQRAEEELELARGLAALEEKRAQVESDRFLTAEERQTIVNTLLREENALLEEKLRRLDAIIATEADGQRRLEYQREREAAARQRSGNLGRMGENQPLDWRGQVGADMADWVDSMGTRGERIAALFTGPIRAGLQSTRDYLQQILGTTDYWERKLGTIGGSVMGALTGAVADLFQQWIAGRIRAAAISMGLSAEEGAVDTAAKMPGAILTSISSFGVAAVIGLAAVLAALASFGAFAAGGPVSGREQLIRVNERGPEFVLNAPARARFGDSFLGRLNAGILDLASLPGDVASSMARPYYPAPAAAAGPASGAGSAPSLNASFALLNFRGEMRRFMQTEGNRMAYDFNTGRTRTT